MIEERDYHGRFTKGHVAIIKARDSRTGRFARCCTPQPIQPDPTPIQPTPIQPIEVKPQDEIIIKPKHIFLSDIERS